MESKPSPFPPGALDRYKLQETLEAAQEELVRLLKEREDKEWRINTLQNDIVHLAALCHVEVVDPMRQLGLTDAVRWIFARDKNKSLSVKQVVDALQSWSEASTYKNLPANVHTIFRRLKKAGDIKLAELPRYPAALGKTEVDDEEKFTWGGGLPPLPPRLREVIKK